MIETLMMMIVKQNIAVSASFFRNSTDAFQRRFVDIRITGQLLDFAIRTQKRRKDDTY